MRRLAAIIVLAALAAAVPAGAAHASVLVYRCGAGGANLCSIAPDGTGRRALTSDGTADFPYIWPSLSRDGRFLAFVKSSDGLYVMTTATGKAVGPITRSATFAVMRPDGGRVGAIDLYPSVLATGLTPIACSFDLAGGDRHCTIAVSTLGWAPDGQFLIDRPAKNAKGTDGICLLTSPDGSYYCTTFVATDPDGDVRDPAVSPDGRVLAVTVTAPGTTAGRIVLYSYPSGRVLRTLTAGPRDGTPAWSPDGARVAFERAGSIYVTSASGTPGSERRLTAGFTPTWGGPADVAVPVLSGVKVTDHQRGAGVRAELKVGRRGSTVRAELFALATAPSGRTVTVGRLLKRGVPAGRLRLSVPLTSRGRAALRASGRLRVTLRITVTPPAGPAASVRRSVTLKP